jgi:phospholipid/cholesterol/gamma-HCH transport system permease protein
VGSLRTAVTEFFTFIGELGLFGIRAIRRMFTRPFEIGETVNQIYDAGWRSLPLVIASGFAFGVILALQTRTEMQSFGAGAMIPQAVSTGLFRDIGALIAALLIAGRVGAGISAELAVMRVTEQIDALEAIGVDSFKYLAVTRILACVIIMPVLTLILNFSGLVGGLLTDVWALQMSPRAFVENAFQAMSWADYIPPTVKTVVFGFLIGTVASYLGYNASQGATGVGRASTRSVVYSLLLVMLSDVILVKVTQFFFET